MRNILIHEYFAVDLELVWDTIQKDLPDLKKQMKKLQKNERLVLLTIGSATLLDKETIEQPEFEAILRAHGIRIKKVETVVA